MTWPVDASSSAFGALMVLTSFSTTNHHTCYLVTTSFSGFTLTMKNLHQRMMGTGTL